MSDERRTFIPIDFFPSERLDRRREFLGEFTAQRPSLAARIWAAYYLATDLFDGTKGQVPEHQRGASNHFAVEARRFFTDRVGHGTHTPEEFEAARAEGHKLAEELQAVGWRLG